MSDVEQARRKLFEDWARREIGQEPSVLYRRDFPGSTRLGQYVNESVESFWLGFNAALDSVEIELPQQFTYYEQVTCEASSSVMDAHEVYAAIESAGLGIKTT